MYQIIGGGQLSLGVGNPRDLPHPINLYLYMYVHNYY